MQRKDIKKDKTKIMFERTELLIGKENQEKLKHSSVMVVGLGGVGAYAAENICRAGVGNMTIIDGDKVSSSNINRQLIAMNSTIDKSKALLMKDRLLDINPNLNLTVIDEYIRDDKMIDIIKNFEGDWIVDAIDTFSPKLYLIIHSIHFGKKIVSSMGSGGKIDPSLIQITDISQTYNCPLASMIRKHLHKNAIYEGVVAVFSPEKVPENAMIEDISTNKRTTVGTISYMPAMFGLMISSVVIRELIGKESYKKVKDTKYYANKKV